jgi:hypothetical protein
VWARQMDGAITFLENLKALPAMHGETWRIKMFAFYFKNVVQLIACTPANAQVQLRSFQKRLKALKSGK